MQISDEFAKNLGIKLGTPLCLLMLVVLTVVFRTLAFIFMRRLSRKAQ